MKVSRQFKLAVFLPLLIALLAGCGRNPPERVEEIVLGAAPGIYSSPVWIAENKGYFREQGLNVNIKEFESGRTALQNMLSGEGIDIVTAAQTPVVFNSFTRNDYAIVSGIVYSENDFKVVGRRDRGVNAAADLKGKTVGFTAGSSGHLFLVSFLAYYQMRVSDIKTIDMEPGHLSQALIEGQVDAIATWEPHIYKARKVLVDKALLLPGKGIYRADFYCIVKKDFIRSHSETLKRFLRAIEEAEEFIRKNNKDAMEIVAQRLKIDREMLHETWDNFTFRLFMDQSVLTSLEDEARWTVKNRLTAGTKVPNYLDYLDTDALQAVKPEAVSLAGK